MVPVRRNGEIAKIIEELNAVLLRYGTTRIVKGVSSRHFTIVVPKGTDLEILSQIIQTLSIVRSAGPIALPVPTP